MAEPMSDERLAEIRARVNAATPGPWTWSPGMIAAPGTDEHFGSEIILWAGNIPGEYDDDDAAAALGACGLRAEDDAAANLEFLAAAREDVPALLAEVERLRGVVAEFGTTSIEWFVHFQGSTGRDYYEGPYDSARDAQRAFGPISGKWNIVSRPVGEWREADR